ncbi:molybdopterin adenylyltransferase [Oxalobacter paraformigenes]|uniref:Molybdopterin adenylyltransferase n=1 Tax=Oxalobacter paraformigenes TaxID=556268 RepID=C3X6E0_9BURK|nr:molybdopterin adenylyltransferase [Oxalobacter paraformigenes]EEO28776.2 molybdenum cofactor synthesis domain-containing protein [Oxalobacter paraformigenes]
MKKNASDISIGLVSVSDRAYEGSYPDLGIPALKDWLASALTSPYWVETRLIPDDREQIQKTLHELVDEDRCSLILTTGGTGPARRDQTPDATLAVGTREMPGIAERMRQISLHFVPTAILSRQVAVICERPDHAALILNLPGRPAAIRQTLEGVRDKNGTIIEPGIFTAIPYCIDLIGGPYIETNEAVCKAWRPQKETS